jgi:hypothetical protein
MNEHVYVVVVPRDMPILNKISTTLVERLPPDQAGDYIAVLRRSYDERTAPGKVERVPHEPRGFTGDFRIDDGQTLVFVGQENLAASGEWDKNGSRLWRIAVHEIGHAVQRTVLDRQWAVIKKMAIVYYSDRGDSNDRYHEGDEQEFFAEFTEIWFGVHQKDLNQKGWNVGDVPAKYAPMLRVMEEIYGPARNVRGG